MFHKVLQAVLSSDGISKQDKIDMVQWLSVNSNGIDDVAVKSTDEDEHKVLSDDTIIPQRIPPTEDSIPQNVEVVKPSMVSTRKIANKYGYSPSGVRAAVRRFPDIFKDSKKYRGRIVVSEDEWLSYLHRVNTLPLSEENNHPYPDDLERIPALSIEFFDDVESTRLYSASDPRKNRNNKIKRYYLNNSIYLSRRDVKIYLQQTGSNKKKKHKTGNKKNTGNSSDRVSNKEIACWEHFSVVAKRMSTTKEEIERLISSGLVDVFEYTVGIVNLRLVNVFQVEYALKSNARMEVDLSVFERWDTPANVARYLGIDYNSLLKDINGSKIAYHKVVNWLTYVNIDEVLELYTV